MTRITATMEAFPMTKVLFVCLGNICRSPTAEGVFRELVRRRGLEKAIAADSAGTSGWHIDAPPDTRARAEAKRRGISIDDLRSRQVSVGDFERFDYVIAMDDANVVDLEAVCPGPFRNRIHLFTDFAPEGTAAFVPDPYYGGPDGFAQVFDLVTQCAEGLLAHITKERQREDVR
jgi:protein-tyrosine phosphatase